MKKIIDWSNLLTTFIGVLAACLLTVYFNKQYDLKLYRNSLDTYYLLSSETLDGFDNLISFANDKNPTKNKNTVKEDLVIKELLKNIPKVLVQIDFNSISEMQGFSSAKLVSLLIRSQRNAIFTHESIRSTEFRSCDHLIRYCEDVQEYYARLCFSLYSVASENDTISFSWDNYDKLQSELKRKDKKLELHKIKIE